MFTRGAQTDRLIALGATAVWLRTTLSTWSNNFSLVTWEELLMIQTFVLRTACAAAAFALVGLGAASGRAASLAPVADGYLRNDTQTSPSTGGNRTDFFGVRTLDQGPTTTRKHIGIIKWDISGVDPSTYDSATLFNQFWRNNLDGNGVWTVYGLNDGETNTDDVADGSFGEANWFDTNGTTQVSFDKGLGVVVGTPRDNGDLGIDLTEVAELGFITLVDGQPLESNTTDLPLGDFLRADSNGFVTLLFADTAASGREWRLGVREASNADTDFGTRMNFATVPEPCGMGLIGVVLAGWGVAVRRGRKWLPSGAPSGRQR